MKSTKTEIRVVRGGGPGSGKWKFLGVIGFLMIYASVTQPILKYDHTVGPAVLGFGLVCIIVSLIGFAWNPSDSVVGNCPHCGHKDISIAPKTPGFNCPACNKRIIYRGDEFHTVDDDPSEPVNSEILETRGAFIKTPKMIKGRSKTEADCHCGEVILGKTFSLDEKKEKELINKCQSNTSASKKTISYFKHYLYWFFGILTLFTLGAAFFHYSSDTGGIIDGFSVGIVFAILFSWLLALVTFTIHRVISKAGKEYLPEEEVSMPK